LASQGGYLDPALRIAVVVRDREYETVVYRGPRVCLWLRANLVRGQDAAHLARRVALVERGHGSLPFTAK
jgi:hypothetical protein